MDAYTLSSYTYTHTDTQQHSYSHTYIYTYMCVYMCMSMFAGKKGDSKSIWKRGERGAKKTSLYTKNSNFTWIIWSYGSQTQDLWQLCLQIYNVYKFLTIYSLLTFSQVNINCIYFHSNSKPIRCTYFKVSCHSP